MRAARTGPLSGLTRRLRRSWRRFSASLRIQPPASNYQQLKLWLIAFATGAASGYVALGFVLTIRWLNATIYGGEATRLADAVANAPVWVLFAGPMAAGLAVGVILHLFRDNAPYTVADVIEARALTQGRIDAKRGALSTLAAAISLGGGASSGREGPVVVAGASLATLVSDRLKLSPLEARTVLGCGVAAAVSASFNAPIAGALFALEVVLGHYAIRAFAPITIASVVGAVISRTHLSAEPAFQLPDTVFGSYAQFPAFMLLGLVSAFAAIGMMGAVFLARDAMDEARRRISAPLWAQPVAAGALLGVLAIGFPHVLGVGYQTVTEALAGRFGEVGVMQDSGLFFQLCVVLALTKILAVAITIGGRFAGGVFSPALLLGALTGAAFGAVALELFPTIQGEQVGSISLYALAGMGAVSGAVLGAPISTTLIVFELTGDYATAIAVMVSTSVATVATQQIVGRSFFYIQLARRSIDLSGGPQSFLLPNLKVGDTMRPFGAEDSPSETQAWELVRQGAYLSREDGLDRALPMFREGKLTFLPVVDVPEQSGPGGACPGETERAPLHVLAGALFYADALRAFNRALVETHAEEHT
ncbi:MAG: chloride channel protein [Pseudomonadota bacterium]